MRWPDLWHLNFQWTIKNHWTNNRACKLTCTPINNVIFQDISQAKKGTQNTNKEGSNTGRLDIRSTHLVSLNTKNETITIPNPIPTSLLHRKKKLHSNTVITLIKSMYKITSIEQIIHQTNYKALKCYRSSIHSPLIVLCNSKNPTLSKKYCMKNVESKYSNGTEYKSSHL